MEEYFDVLNEEGMKTGETKLRGDVHRDGDWHKSVHIWVINQKGDVLLQRRSANKDSYPNMLDISCAGHLSAGDDSLEGAIRELKEELNVDIKPTDLQFIKTLKKSSIYNSDFINNEFTDLYFLNTTLKIEDMEFQKEELQDLFYVTYKELKDMVNQNHPELVISDESFKILFSHFDSKFDKI